MLRMRLPVRMTAARGLLLVAVAIGLVLVSGAASASVAPGLRAHGMPFAGGSTTKVIVLLRGKAAGLGARSIARSGVIRAEVRPLAQTLRSHGARNVSSGRALPFVIASVTAAQEAALKQNPAVKAVFPDSVIPAPAPQLSADTQLFSPFTLTTSSPTPTAGPGICPSNPVDPERDSEALSVINAPDPTSSINGAGVKVAYIAGGIDTTIADFQRNGQYASSGSTTGSPVVTNVNFSGDPDADTPGGASTESFLDASSIASQGNETFDLSNFVNAAHPLPAGCNITITGSAPGATVTGIDVFSNDYDTTESNFIQAIDYAVATGVNVLNESFGANNFPDTALDATRIADDDAVAAGVTVVVSSGDAGVTSTIGSPATDTNVISAGASTTFRGYAQDTYGGINATSPNATNGTWIDNNISSISSGGFAQSGGNTVDLVAPGDLNWIDCSASFGCSGAIQLEGGTSESAPLTSGAAADVIQAYRSTHGGSSPTPALVKQILMSTATDIHAPAEQQGAGLLNIGAAVKEAESINGASGTPQGGLLIGPNQIHITQDPGKQTKRSVAITNTGSHAVTVSLSTRTLTHKVSSRSGSFCLNPQTSGTNSCGGPPTANTFAIWSGVTEVYQEETFSVPSTNAPSRLNFSANYPDTGQGSLLHVALYDPTGAYAGYSLPQGLANYANVQVADPKPGTWTAVFFTEQDGATPGGAGTTGTIQWQADTWTSGPGGQIAPGSLNIAPGATKTAIFTAAKSPDPGDVADSIVVNSSDGTTNTVPVTVRTLVNIGPSGGTFTGVLTGGNGRGNPAQTNTYAFNVPTGRHEIDASVNLGIFDDGVVAFLVDPEGNTVANSSSITLDSSGSCCLTTPTVNVYKDNPQPGPWKLVLNWLPVAFGTEFSQLSQPFTGRIRFNKVHADSNLPHGAMKLRRGESYTFDVTVRNTAASPESYFLDPRLGSKTTMQLPDQTGSDQNMTLPLPPGVSFPLYFVPTDTSAVQTSLTTTGSYPVTYDMEWYTGDPDLGAVRNGNNATLNLNSGDEIPTGALAPQSERGRPVRILGRADDDSQRQLQHRDASLRLDGQPVDR